MGSIPTPAINNGPLAVLGKASALQAELDGFDYRPVVQWLVHLALTQGIPVQFWAGPLYRKVKWIQNTRKE